MKTPTNDVVCKALFARAAGQGRGPLLFGAYIWSVDDYLRVDELPGGRGYADLAFVPRPGSKLPPLVVELKWDRPVDAAIGQIRARNYPAALAGLAGECVLVGITYREGTDEHGCTIERVALG